MKFFPEIPAIVLLLLLSSPLILAQQPYIRQAANDCSAADDSTSSLGYACNGVNRSCQAYLTFPAVPPFDSVSAIAELLSVNSTELSRLNSVPEDAVFESNRAVLVPAACSCSGQYYQMNTSYIIKGGDTVFDIANSTFQGLTTCQSILAQNSINANALPLGEPITIPVRCACPTKNQSDAGLRYLLSYIVVEGDYVSSVSDRFGAGMGRTLEANGLSEQDSTLYSLTTLLIPLRNPPTSSQLTAPPPPPPPPPPPSATPPGPAPPPGDGSSKSWIYAVVGVIGGFSLAAIAAVIVFCTFFRKKTKKPQPVASPRSYESVEKPLNPSKKKDDSEDILESISTIAQSLKVYTFEELRDATDDFSPTCCINGSVYRATINGDFAAVKKMNGDVSKEITLLNKINHFNVIRLSGVCFNDGSWYLIYEYASNGTLSDWIHRRSQERTVLTWNQRLQISLDVATGLNYLHRYATPPHVHKDLNSSNVLIDHDFRAKIANFRLARSAEGDEGQFALTRHIVGTKGYMAPEYLENGLISPKLDVYAFGILLLEILTAKEVWTLLELGNMQYLSEVIIPVLNVETRQESLKEMMDPLLQGNYPLDLALSMFKLISDCLKRDPSDRPSMDEMCQWLSRISNSSVSGEWAVSISENSAVPR